MSLWKRGRQYWTDFTVAGRRYRKRLATTNVQVAKKRERELIEKAGGGLLAVNEQGPKRLSEAIESYFGAKRTRCSPRTIELEEERISLVQKHFGDVPLSAMTAVAIADFQRARHSAGIANRTINVDVGVLSRVLKSCGRWRALAEHVQNLPERQRPIGRALTADEQTRLFTAADQTPNGSTRTVRPLSPRTPHCGRSKSNTCDGATSISPGSCSSCAAARTSRATASSH